VKPGTGSLPSEKRLSSSFQVLLQWAVGRQLAATRCPLPTGQSGIAAGTHRPKGLSLQHGVLAGHLGGALDMRVGAACTVRQCGKGGGRGQRAQQAAGGLANLQAALARAGQIARVMIMKRP